MECGRMSLDKRSIVEQQCGLNVKVTRIHDRNRPLFVCMFRSIKPIM